MDAEGWTAYNMHGRYSVCFADKHGPQRGGCYQGKCAHRRKNGGDKEGEGGFEYANYCGKKREYGANEKQIICRDRERRSIDVQQGRQEEASLDKIELGRVQDNGDSRPEVVCDGQICASAFPGVDIGAMRVEPPLVGLAEAGLLGKGRVCGGGVEPGSWVSCCCFEPERVTGHINADHGHAAGHGGRVYLADVDEDEKRYGGDGEQSARADADLAADAHAAYSERSNASAAGCEYPWHALRLGARTRSRVLLPARTLLPVCLPPAAMSSPGRHSDLAHRPSLLSRLSSPPPAAQSHDAGHSGGHRRLFSLSRKSRHDQHADDSPGSPLEESRPSLAAYNLGGSMRLGTQTLIQALQALPLDDRSDGDADAFSSEDEEDSTPATMASSIHAIHLPVARSRRNTQSVAHLPDIDETAQPAVLQAGEVPPEEIVGEELDSAGPDFEQPSMPATPSPVSEEPMSPPAHAQPAASARRHTLTRSQSMSTIRQNRRAELAKKLAEVFEIEGIEEVVAEMPCWLLRSILLQGYMYLTNTHLCFFAHLPSREDQVLKSGTLNKKAQRTKRWNKHWFVLKDDVLSWYHTSTDLYFPHGVLDLRYAISCDAQGEMGLRLRTTQKIVELSADSVPSRDEWVKAIRKVIFKAQNQGESVKIAIPYAVILDVDKSSAMDFSETIEVKVVDKDQHSGYSVDSYFFAYFKNIDHALDEIREIVKTYRVSPTQEADDVVKDTTSARSPSHTHTQFEHGHAATEDSRSSKFKSLLKPFATTDATTALSQSFKRLSSEFPFPSSSSSPGHGTPTSPPPSQEDVSSSTSTLARPSRHGGAEDEPATILGAPLQLSPSPSQSSSSAHTYPPSTSSRPAPVQLPTASSWNFPQVASWLRNPSKLFSAPPGAQRGGVVEVFSHSRRHSHSVPQSGDNSQEFGFSILEAHDAGHDGVDPMIADKFRDYFAFDERESLLGYFPGTLFRVLPVPGKVYISSNHFCFRSSSRLTRTRMIIPIRDILSTEKTKPFRFGQYGLVVVIRGYEELFFEFNGADKRDACADLLVAQVEDAHTRLHAGEISSPPQTKRETLVVEDIVPEDIMRHHRHDSEPRPPPESGSESVPAVMFTSTSSTFLTFKPQESLRITLLTIGSRGDVQPYIALGKGLIADGHKVKIATHAEFKEWIESHGMEYGHVGGDPAELMRICVENGTFTVGFIREGVQKFRGWIDDLLKTSYESCKGSDLLIESPSAMAGIHIAEALKIPYYRAFTMPWTRTRAYPHAFAVPEHKMGGSYNYMTYVMFDQVLWRGTASQINRWRRRTLGLPPTNLDKMEQHKVPFLYNFSPTIVPPPLDWYEWIRVTGYWYLDDADVSAKKWQAPQDLLDFIASARDAGKKIVYVGFGSIVVPDPTSLTRTVVDAIQQSGVHAILSKGWSDRLANKKRVAQTEPEVQLPSSIFPIASVPHDWLFSRIDAACHHGGAGTTGASLRAGIPTIIKPFFGDQFFWADRVEALGIGSSVRKLTVESLAQALHTATTDEKQIAKAAIVGQQLRAENGVATAIECIYRDLEYARTLVHRRHSDHSEENATIRENHYSLTSSSDHSPHLDPYTDSSNESHNGSSAAGAPSEDWSVISSGGPDEDRRAR